MDETWTRDIASLKRPALQKLCKKFGIKANGKNVDMIKALQELRDSTGFHSTENMPHSQPSQSEASVTLPDIPSPDIEKMNPSSRKCKKGGKGKRKKREAPRGISNQQSLDLSLPTSSNGDTPLPLSGVSCSWSTSTASFNLSESKNICDQSVQKSPFQGRKRTYNESSNSPPEVSAPGPVTKYARYESPHQLCESILQNVGNDPIYNEQPSEAPSSSPQASFSPSKIPISPPQAPISLSQSPISPPLAPVSPSQSSISPPQAPISTLQSPVSSPQARISPPQITSQSPISPLQAPICLLKSPTSPQAPFSPPLTSDDLQYNSNRKRKSTYTLVENHCDEDNAVKDESREPPSKRVRRATFSKSPKIISDEIKNTNESVSGNVEFNDVQVLSGIVDVHSEIMDLLDKRVEKIQADPNYKPFFSGSKSFSSKMPLKSSTAIAKKFDSAHKKQFSRMRSIVGYQCDKERRHVAVRKGSTPHTMACSGKIPRLTEKQISKIPNAPTRATTKRSKSVSTFKPSTLSVKQASFNYPVDGAKSTATNVPRLGSKPIIMSVNKTSLNFCENGVRKSAAISKTPGKNRDVVSKTPSNVFKFAAKTSTKKSQPQGDINKSLKKKPTYQPYTGKLPDFKISRY